jgi:KipI family sensor histidine kinase inhibitor
MKVRECGDSMLLVEFEPVIDSAVNERAIALAARVRSRQLRGVRDVAPGYCTVGVHFDPLQIDLPALEGAIADEARVAGETEPRATMAPVEIGVSYGGVEGPDLDEVAAHAGCTAADVIERHAARVYRVYMLGFVPGFAYMGRVDPSIATPRHRVPRERVPAGSVGIAGEQTGVYPVASPGGWRLIGRTDRVMFDASRSPASLLAPGDLVRFVPMTDGRRR